MTLTLNIPDAVAPQVVDGICAATGWTVGSCKTKNVWAKEQVILAMKRMAANGIVKDTMATSKAAMDAAVIT